MSARAGVSPQVRLSAVVMAHPSRLDRAEALAARHPELNLRVVLDPQPDGERSTLRPAAAAWSAVAPGATHHLVVQDDALLCKDFATILTAALATFPDHAIALFCEWGSDTSFLVRHAALAGVPWVEVSDHYVPSVALVLPAAVAAAFGSLATANLDDWVKQDDVSLRYFLFERGVPVVCPVPNLADHDPSPSLAGNDHMGPRRSACFRDDVGAPDIDGDAVLLPVTVPHYSWYTGDALCVVRDETHPYGWRTDPAQVEVERRGLAPAVVRELARARVARWRGEFPGLPSTPLERFWLSAFLLGVVLADDPVRSTAPNGVPLPDRPPPADIAALDRAMSGPAAARALATMSQGTLRAAADPGVLALLEDPLADLVRDAVRLGYATAGDR